MISNFKGEHGWASNFSYHGFWYGGVWYKTNEHFFQAMKTLDQAQRVAISKAPTPGIAKKMASKNGYRMPDGNLFKITLRSDWYEIRVPVMLFGLRKKFGEHDQIAEKLMTSHPHYLMEGNYWHDNFWGNCTCGKKAECKERGSNMLGELLMIVRQELINIRDRQLGGRRQS